MGVNGFFSIFCDCALNTGNGARNRPVIAISSRISRMSYRSRLDRNKVCMRRILTSGSTETSRERGGPADSGHMIPLFPEAPAPPQEKEQKTE